MKTIEVGILNEGCLREGGLRIDEDNVLLVSFVPTKVGYKAAVTVGLHKYGANMLSWAYDNALVQLLKDEKTPLMNGMIYKGEFKCFLRELPSAVCFNKTLYNLEYVLL